MVASMVQDNSLNLWAAGAATSCSSMQQAVPHLQGGLPAHIGALELHHHDSVMQAHTSSSWGCNCHHCQARRRPSAATVS